MEGETTTAMTAFLSMLAEVCKALMTQVTEVCSFIIETPLLVFTVGIMVPRRRRWNHLPADSSLKDARPA